MKACGLIVEYNPFHYGHLYHIQKAKELSGADCVIAIMSGSFLQRGEPAIIDKFYRAKAALKAGVDIVLELPYAYAVQSSTYFAHGAVLSLAKMGIHSLCFGSESGRIDEFLQSYSLVQKNEQFIKPAVKSYLNKGMAYPKAYQLAYQEQIQSSPPLDITKPNNILGLSYVQTILDHQLPIEMLTIQRLKSDYHEQQITGKIASATSIRRQLIEKDYINGPIQQTMPEDMVQLLKEYKEKTSLWHTWEKYFPFLHYRVMTMKEEKLQQIKGVDEGLENRIKETAKKATTFHHWMQAIKTKRYTWTRLQRMFVHILTNTTKKETINKHKIPYLRILGMSQTGRKYLNQTKKKIDVPLFTQLKRDPHPILKMEERATNAYYSILPAKTYHKMRKQEVTPPIFLD